MRYPSMKYLLCLTSVLIYLSSAPVLAHQAPTIKKGQTARVEKTVPIEMTLQQRNQQLYLVVRPSPEHLELYAGSRKLAGIEGKNQTRFDISRHAEKVTNGRLRVIATDRLGKKHTKTLDVSKYLDSMKKSSQPAVAQTQGRVQSAKPAPSAAARTAEKTAVSNSKVSAFLQKVEKAGSLEQLQRAYSEASLSERDLDQLLDAIKERQYLNKLKGIAQRELSKPGDLPGKQAMTVKKSDAKQSGGTVTGSHAQKLQKIRDDIAVQKNRILRSSGDTLTTAPRSGTTGTALSRTGRVTKPEVSSDRRINSVTPSRARIGRDVTISGKGFGDAQGRVSLLFDGVSGGRSDMVDCDDIVSWANERIIVTIPAEAAGAVSDRDTMASIWVKVAGGQTGPLHDITIMPDLSLLPPRIDHLSHPDIIPNQPLLIQGANFLSQSEGEVFFRFAGKDFPGQISSWDDKLIEVQVPPIVGLLRTPGSVLVRNHAGYEATAVATFSPAIWSDEYWGPGNHGSTSDTRITVQCTPRFGELSYSSGDDLHWLLCVFGEKRENRVTKRLYNGWTVQGGHTDLLDGNGWQGRYSCGAYYDRQPVPGSDVIRVDRVVWANAYSACAFRDKYLLEGPAGVSWDEGNYNPGLACLDTLNRSDLDHLRRSPVSCNEVRGR